VSARSKQVGIRRWGQEGRRPLTLCAAVGVDGPYEDEFGACVGDIAKDVEQVESHGGHSAGPAWSRRACLKRSCGGAARAAGRVQCAEGRAQARAGMERRRRERGGSMVDVLVVGASE
jgi:hypothetical protein